MNEVSTLPSAGSITSSTSTKCSRPAPSFEADFSPSPGLNSGCTSATLLGLAFLALGTDLGGGTALGMTITGLGLFMAGP